MKDLWFSKVENDIYTRQYTISPSLVGGNSVTVCAMCSKNTERINDKEYLLEVYFSVGEYDVREFLSEITIGDGPMGRRALNAEIDEWVEYFVREDGFPQFVSRYLKRMQLYEKWSEDEDS